ncbi:CPBP family intramembrane glutamic endopeptidase [Pleurocapsa sp. CCALA 161]|uniref:CPBP family intramembrane glutamic endopeptidase n=1 Tax=Pleurocapsa sp. CCALA 161 TaxID=2107688 RepID=UPI0018EBA12D|nr:CPBP family intramembrane glutamic endopeptidase [Pleurocapsa sp. CCALA 161]
MIFFGALSILWLPVALPIYWLLRADSNLATILTMALLFVELLFLWQIWGRFVYGDRYIYRRYGLVRNRKNLQEFLQGLAIGFWLCLGLFITEALLGWIEVIHPSASLIRIIIEGLLSAIGIALAEELLFRGWLLDELQRNYRQKTCIWITAIAYALAHFLKPVEEIMRTAITFPALVLLGIALVLAKDKYGDYLGIAIGLHAGLVWGYYIVNVGQLIEYTNRVPVWVTGIDGNPIAGLMGLVFLSGLIGIILSLKGLVTD